jgi:hypothetical protein
MMSERQNTTVAKAYVFVRNRELRAIISRVGPRRFGVMEIAAIYNVLNTEYSVMKAMAAGVNQRWRGALHFVSHYAGNIQTSLQ